MIFPQKKVFHTKNVENVENYVEKNAKKLDFALVGKNPNQVFHNSANIGVEKWKTLLSVRDAQFYHLKSKTA